MNTTTQSRSLPTDNVNAIVTTPHTAAPLLPAAHISPDDTNEAHHPAHLVLLCDDNTAILMVLSEVLELAGYRVLTARNAAEALDLARLHQHDLRLLLCDMALPHRKGTQIAEDLLTLTPDLKILFMTGYVKEEKTYVNGVEARVLLKPIRALSLIHEIETILSDAPV